MVGCSYVKSHADPEANLTAAVYSNAIFFHQCGYGSIQVANNFQSMCGILLVDGGARKIK